MRTSLLSAVAAAALGLAAGSALGADYTAPDEPVADSGWYAGVFGGASWADEIEFDDDVDELELDLDTGFTVGGVLGMHFADHFRGEIEASYADYDIDDCDSVLKCAGLDGDISAFYALANLWFDFDVGGFSPYIGGGVGAAMIDVDFDTFIDDSEWGLAFQAGGGVRFGLADSVMVDVGYRFKGIPDIEVDSFDGELYSHNAQVGLTFEF